MAIRHKYNAKPTISDGIRFDSKAEERYYQKLKLAKESGELLFFFRQTPIHLPGKIKYVIDFLEFWADGEVKFVDVKGFDTAMSKLKRKQAEALYPIEIRVVRNI